jgi:hypothetical protein
MQAQFCKLQQQQQQVLQAPLALICSDRMHAAGTLAACSQHVMLWVTLLLAACGSCSTHDLNSLRVLQVVIMLCAQVKLYATTADFCCLAALVLAVPAGGCGLHQALAVCKPQQPTASSSASTSPCASSAGQEAAAAAAAGAAGCREQQQQHRLGKKAADVIR